MRRLIASMLVLMLAGSAGAASFTSKPAVTPAGEGAKVAFAVSEATDVEVAILDAGGKVVRHLAAGVLGDNAPAPLASGSLKQELTWDGKDDFGKPAGPDLSGFKVRVALGLRPTFGKVIGDNPGGIASVNGLAIAPDGTAYVWHHFGDIHPADSTTICVAYDRDGNYLRQVMPYPANLKEDQLAGLRRLKLDGQTVPFLYQAETRSLIPGLGNVPSQVNVATADGRVVFVGHQEWVGTTLRYNQKGVKQVVVLGSDGSTVDGKVLRTVLDKGSSAGVDLAVSPDGKTFYAVGISESSKVEGQRKPVVGNHAVYKFTLDDEKPTPFVGSVTEPGDGNTQLNGPRGIDVGPDGNVYVADYGNGRVIAFRPDGSYLGQIKAHKAFAVKVHKTTGAIYVIGDDGHKVVKKFSRLGDAAPAASTTIPAYSREDRYWPFMDIDDSKPGEAALWIAPATNWARYKLLRLVESGDAFAKPVDVADLPGNSKPNAGPRTHYNLYTGGSPSGMALDRANRRLYVNQRMYDLETDTWGAGWLLADGTKDGVGSFGLDGNFYSQSYPNELHRLGPDGKAIPFTAGELKGGALRLGGSNRLRGRGVTADAEGNIYVLVQKTKEMSKPGDAGDSNNLVKIAPDGTVTNIGLIDSQIRQLNSVRLDPAGNIYLGVGVRPAGVKVPPAFDGLELGKLWTYSMNSLDMNWYTLLYGMIVKFPPAGGTIRKGSDGVPVEFGYMQKTEGKTEIKGAEWTWFGASPVVSWRIKYPDVCLCESPRFDVDGFGRSFFPDAARFRCGVLDTNGNVIAWFGDYGNQDSGGPGSAVPTPGIGFYWPFMLAVEDGTCYVADRLNRRVVAVDLRHEASETVTIP